MIRQDKITFLISTFQEIEAYSFIECNYDVHDNQFKMTNGSERVFKRVGVISRFETNPSKILTKYIPVNKHDFLDKSLKEFSSNYCIEENPFCSNCFIDRCCDYYNKKNDWSQNE